MSRFQKYGCGLRYMLAACLVFSLGHFQYRLLYLIMAWMPLRAGSAWGGHFVLTTLWAHSLHRGFTFRGTPQLPYRTSLLRTCSTRLVLMMLSTAMMLLLCDWRGFSPIAGWAITSFSVGIIDFFTMSRFSICA